MKFDLESSLLLHLLNIPSSSSSSSFDRFILLTDKKVKLLLKMDQSTPTTTRLLTLLNVSATKPTKRKLKYLELTQKAYQAQRSLSDSTQDSNSTFKFNASSNSTLASIPDSVSDHPTKRFKLQPSASTSTSDNSSLSILPAQESEDQLENQDRTNEEINQRASIEDNDSFHLHFSTDSFSSLLEALPSNSTSVKDAEPASLPWPTITQVADKKGLGKVLFDSSQPTSDKLNSDWEKTNVAEARVSVRLDRMLEI